MGQPPNLRELISSADGVTFWAKHDKAMSDLGYSPRSLEPAAGKLLGILFAPLHQLPIGITDARIG